MSYSKSCRYCGKQMSGKAKTAYCSEKCRFADWEDQRSGRHRVEACEYCGMPAETMDHIPPRSARKILEDSGVASRYKFITVPACRECNSLLGAKSLFTLHERKKFIKKALKKRYAKYLRVGEFDEYEMKELGYSLQKMILFAQLMAEMTKSRIEWE